MNRFYNKKDIPHKGWLLLDCIDTEVADNKCDMCDKENIRYLHKMYHPELSDYLYVGCVCAGNMTTPYQAELLERKARNKTIHKKKYMNDDWKILPIDKTNNYEFKMLRDTIWGIYTIKDKWYYNVDYVHSNMGYDTKQQALDSLYNVYRKMYL